MAGRCYESNNNSHQKRTKHSATLDTSLCYKMYRDRS
jgi:hypothetical protein